MPKPKSGSQYIMDDFSAALKQRLRGEGIEIAVSARIVDVPRGHLAVVLTLSSPDSSGELDLRLDQRVRAESIAREACVKYFFCSS